jgi:O-antigen/teichoic acid export membrane protein
VSGVNSYRAILRGFGIIGGGQLASIAIGLVKLKIVAAFLGPAGVGLVGLYSNLMQIGATVASLGIGNAGTRQIAAATAAGDDQAVERTRYALFWGVLALAVVGSVLFWAVSGWVARVILADPASAPQLAWLSLGVGLSVASGYHTAILTGMRQLVDLARITIGAGLVSALLGVSAIFYWGEAGLLAMVLVVPAITLVLGQVFVAKLPSAPRSARGPVQGAQKIAHDWRELARIGPALMLSSLVTLLGHLATLTLVERSLGADAMGHFQAAWTVGMLYLGFVLGAMNTDYFPRLAAANRDDALACRLVNQQTEVSLLVCAPVLLGMLGCAPWVIQLVYSAEFRPAVEILRWQLLGDILKVLSWPLANVIPARGAGKTFLMIETLAMAALIVTIWIGLPLVGVTITGIAFLGVYGLYLILARWLGGSMISFQWSRHVIYQALALIAAAILVDITSRVSDLGGALLGITLALAFGLFALLRLSHQAEIDGHLGKVAGTAARLTDWMKR